MSLNKSELQKVLDTNIPKEVVSSRSQAGRDLSYLETWYVIDRMNQVFGQGNWSYSTIKLDKVFEGEVEQTSGKVFATSYIATVGVHALVDGRPTQFVDVGYGDGTDKKSPGKAHELATKEAVSDGVKRCIKNFGRSMGLALYDKTQEFVGAVQGKTPAVEPSTKGITAVGKSEPISTATKDLITGAFKVLEAQKKITAEGFKEKYTKGKGLSTLAASEITVIYNNMKKDFPELNSNGKGT
jgi:DNA recombination protein Rad52